MTFPLRARRAAAVATAVSVVAAGCGTPPPPAARGGSHAEAAMRGTVRGSGLPTIANASVYARAYPSGTCGEGSPIGWWRTVSDAGGRYVLPMPAVVVAPFTACVEVSVDTLRVDPWHRVRGVAFRNTTPYDTVTLDLTPAAP
jgi:hypothetical protein